MKNFKILICLVINVLCFQLVLSAQVSLDKKTENAAWRKSYKFVEEFINGYARVNDSDGNIGMIDSLGKLVLPIKYSSLGNVKNNTIVFSNKDEKYGLLNLKGDTVFACKYRYLYQIELGKYVCFKDQTDSTGMMDIKGKIIFPDIYTTIRPTPNPDYFVLYDAQYKCGLFTTTKEILPIEYESLQASNNGKYIVANKNGKSAILDFNTNIIAPYNYERISLSPDNQTFIGVKNKLSAYLTIAEKEILPYKYETLSFPMADGFFIVSEKGKYSIIDKKGTPLFPFEYDDIEMNDVFLRGTKGDTSDVLFTSGKRIKSASAYNFTLENKRNYISVTLKNKKIGILDETGKEIYPFEFDDFSFVGNDMVIVTKDKKHALCKFSAIASANYKYDALQIFKYDDNDNVVSLRAKKLNKFGLIDVNERPLIPFEYDSLANFGYKNKYILARKGTKFGIVNEANKTILPFEYNIIKRVLDTLFCAYKDNINYFLNAKGKVLASNFYVEYNDIGIHKIGKYFYFETKKYQYGAIDEEGNTVLPFEYNVYLDDRKDYDRDSLLVAHKDDNAFFINVLQAKVVSEAYKDIIAFDKIKAVKKDGKYTFLNGTTLKPISGFVYDKAPEVVIFYHAGNRIMLCQKDGFYDVLDEKLMYLKRKMDFDTMYGFDSRYIVAKKGNNITYFDNLATQIIIPQGFEFHDVAKEKFVIFKKQIGLSDADHNNPKYKYGLSDHKGKIIQPAIFDKIVSNENGFRIHNESKFGYLRNDGSVWLAAEYDNIEIEDNRNYIILKKDGLFGVITKDEKVVFPSEYINIEYAEYSFVLGKKVKALQATRSSSRRGSPPKTKFEETDKTPIVEGDDAPSVFRTYENPPPEAPEEPRKERVPPVNSKGEYKTEELQSFDENNTKTYVEAVKYGVIGEDKQIIIPFIYDQIQFLDDQTNVFVVKNNDLEGIIDRTGKILIPLMYRNIKPCYHGCNTHDQRYVAEKDGLYGVIDRNNKVYVPFEYQYGSIRPDQNNRGKFYLTKDRVESVLMPNGSEEFPLTEQQIKYNLYDAIRHGYLDDEVLVVRRGLRWGFINRKSEQLTPIKYTEVENYYINGSILVSSGVKKGVVYQGKEVLPCEYDQILNVSNDAKKFIVQKDDKIGLVDAQNLMTIYDNEKQITDKYRIDFTNTQKQQNTKISYDLQSADKGYAIFIKKKVDVYFRGLFDKEKNMILPYEYQRLDIATERLCIFKKDRGYGVIDIETKKVIIDDVFDYIKFMNNKFIVNYDKKVGIFDLNGKEIIPINYLDIQFNAVYSNYTLSEGEEKVSIADEKGNILAKSIKIEYNVSARNSYLLIDSLGKLTRLNSFKDVVSSDGYSLELDPKQDLYLLSKKENRKQLLLTDCQLNTDFSLPIVSENLICLYIKDEQNYYNFGYMDLKGKWMIEPKYKGAEPFKNSFAIVNDYRKYSFINKKGEEIVPFDFDKIGNFTPEGIAPVFIGNKVGLINTKGELVVPFIYYHTGSDKKLEFEFENGLLPVRLTKYIVERHSNPNEGIVYINVKGEIVFQ